MIRALNIFVSLVIFPYSVLLAMSVCLANGHKGPVILPKEEIIATFGDGRDQELMVWVQAGENQMIFIDDVGFDVEYCVHPDLLICIKQPITLLLPKSRQSTEIRLDGLRFEVVTSSGEEAERVENVCKSDTFWLRIMGVNGEQETWYFFNRSEGLLDIISFINGDQIDRIPGAIYLRTSGKIFTFDEICTKSPTEN